MPESFAHKVLGPLHPRYLFQFLTENHGTVSVVLFVLLFSGLSVLVYKYWLDTKRYRAEADEAWLASYDGHHVAYKKLTKKGEDAEAMALGWGFGGGLTTIFIVFAHPIMVPFLWCLMIFLTCVALCAGLGIGTYTLAQKAMTHIKILKSRFGEK